MPRSGHAMCTHGKYVILSGGIDFIEEVAYNDLYALNTGDDRLREGTSPAVH